MLHQLINSTRYQLWPTDPQLSSGGKSWLKHGISSTVYRAVAALRTALSSTTPSRAVSEELIPLDILKFGSDTLRWSQRASCRAATAALFSLPVIILSGPATAEIEVLNQDGFVINIALEAGAYYARSDGVNFGAGQTDLRTGITGDDTVGFFDGYLKPSIDATYDTDTLGTFYGGIAQVATITRGDGDPGGYTDGSEEDIANERLFAGWRSGTTFGEGYEDVVDISFGRQDFTVGDAFLIGDGNFDEFGKGNYWLAPRNAFERAALLRVNTNPVRGDAFYLTSDSDQDNSELIGFNLEYVNGDLGTIGGSYMRVLDSDDVAYVRDDMDIISVRGQGNPFTTLPDIFLAAEYVRETGGAGSTKIDASAWYGEIGYTFSDTPWSPTLTYRYSQFTGDDPDTRKYEAFDPLFYAYSRGWGTWFQGEVVGEYLLFNSNQRTHMVHATVTPNDQLSAGLIYYSFRLDEADYYGTPVSDKSFADEFDLYVDWYPIDQLTLGALYGIALPDDGARMAFGSSRAFQLFQVYLILNL